MATTEQINQFIQKIGSLAVAECQKRPNSWVLPSVCIAQACLETGYGTSSLMTTANAFFGIKAGSSWTGKVYNSKTKEVYNGVTQTITAGFRAYDNPSQSVSDYYDLITNNARYSKAVNNKDSLSTITAIKNAGYATDPNYISSVYGIIRKYDLTQYDAVVLNEETPVSYTEGSYQYYDAINNTENSTSSTTASTTDSSKKVNEEEPFFGYNKAGFVEVSKDTGKKLYDQTIKVADNRKLEPLAAFDNIAYGHRIYANEYSLKLGDCLFLLPPEFISIISESQSDNIVTLRQENTNKIKNGYQRRSIIIDLVFHGKNQINGYKVESPEGYYYVDGLRQLLAQFKCTPFLPIVNELINNTYGIFTVALQSIVFQTVPGYPNLMSANITLQEASVAQYIEVHDLMFHTCIDWDLFRFYYQRLLTEEPKYQKLKSMSLSQDQSFKLSILNENVFNALTDDEKYNFYNVLMDNEVVIEDSTTNYVTYLDSDVDSFKISSFQCAYSNVLTTIQMADYNSPIIQYMGGLDTIFNINFETMDRDVVSKLEGAQIKNNSLIRDNHDYNGIGFVKLESELVEFTGARFVLIDSVTTNTVPGFPGLINVSIQCVSFDVSKDQVESLNGFKPFNHKGTKNDCIQQSFESLLTKVDQDLYAEEKLRKEMELYPDLRLPTYSEVNEVIKKIQAFRSTHKNIDGEPLSLLPYDVYPQTPQKILHGSSNTNVKPVTDSMGYVKNVYELTTSLSYSGYVDPDFYVFYPYDLNKLEQSEKDLGAESSFDVEMPKPSASKTVYSKKIYSNADDKTTSSVSIANETVNSSVDKFLSLLSTKLGCEYVWGSVGPNTFDCSGFITWGLRTFGILKSDDRFTTATLPSRTDFVKEIPITEAMPGDILHYRNSENTAGHVAISIGNGKIIHAGNAEGGTSCVNIRKASYMNFQRAFRILALEEDSITNATQVQTARTNSSLVNLKRGNKGEAVKQLQSLLNTLIAKKEIKGPTLNEDGIFGEKTEAVVKQAQAYYKLSQTGIWSEKENEAMSLTENSVNYSTTNNANSNYISSEELESIARIIAGEARGGSYIEQLAIAQVIFDRFTDKKSRWGNLKDILSDRDQFKAPYEGRLEITTCLTAAKAVFCDGEKSFKNQSVYYFLSKDAAVTTYKVRDEKSNRLGTRGQYTFWGEKTKSIEKEFTIAQVGSDEEGNYVLQEAVVVNGVSIPTYSESKKFGMPIMMKTELCIYDEILNTKASAMKKVYNKDTDILMSSFVDMCEYSGRGRLVRAFPTYLFALVDETGEWYDGCKLWSNYYILKSVMDIQVASYNDMPMQTATITVSNVYHNLDRVPTGLYYYSILSDNAYGPINRFAYRHLGMIFGSPKITEKMLDLKNDIYSQMKVRPGVRMHLRMGYGSDPLGLPVVMNGVVTEMSVGETVTFICNSDGVELANAVISTDKSSDNEGLLGLGMFASMDQESSNIIGDLFTKRESSFWNFVNNDWYEGNKYGIEHFGLYFNKNALNKVASTIQTGGTIAASTALGAKLGSLIPIPVAGTLLGAAAGFVVGLFTNDGLSDWNMVQYDICKNIYRGNYKGDLFIYDNFWGFADGEANMVFNLYNKTPWDAIQMAVQNTPEYIGMPMYHQFESRIFYGLPWWMAKYRYDKINGDIYEEAKPHSQVHFVDSMCDIIDNQVTASKRNLYTNAIVMYSLGGSVKASPTLFSDRSITPSQMTTKIYDSSVKQDIIGPDQVYEWMGIEVAKSASTRVGMSQLIYNWEKQYEGELILLGNPAIKPYDYLYLNDTFVGMMGVCTARTVIHSFSSSTGFVTTVVPGCISCSTMNQSQLNVHLANICSVGGYFSYYSSVKRQLMKTAEDLKEFYSTFNIISSLGLSAEIGAKVFTLATSYKVYKTLITGIKNGDMFVKGAKFMSTLTSGIKAMDKFKDIFSVTKASLKTLKTVGAGTASTGAGLLPGVLLIIASTLVEELIEWVVEFFQYNNCIKVFPLIYESKPLMAIESGEKILAFDASPTDDKVSDKLAEQKD